MHSTYVDDAARTTVPAASSQFGCEDLHTRNSIDAFDPSMTYMVVEYPFSADHETERHTRRVLSTFDGTSVPDTANTGKGQRITTTFQNVCDATHAASTLLQHFKALTSPARPDAAGAVRIVFCAAPLAGRSESAAHKIHAEHVTELLRNAGAHQALTTSATAAIAGPTLPAGVELVDLGVSDGADERSGRLYELRVHDHERVDGTPSTASNLDWARRVTRRRVSLSDDDLGALVGRWKGALDGRGTVELLTSPDGHLASAAAAELALRAHADGAVVLHGSWDRGAPRPYGAVREALGVYAAECSLARVRADLDRRVWDVARVLPELGARLGSPPAPPGPQHDEGCRVGDALSGWFRAIAARDDLLLVLDNAQWADRASLHLCEQLSNDLADHRVLVAVCGAENDMRANGTLDATTALTASVDGDEHWISLDAAS